MASMRAMPYDALSESAAIVNVVIASLSLVGGLSMVVGYFCTPPIGHNRLRQRLVLGLGLTDAIQALTVVTGSSIYVDRGVGFAANSPGCNGTGFMYQTTVVVGAAWAVSIAVVTFFTLMKPMSNFTALLEHKHAIYYIWGVVWALGLIPAIVGTILFDMVDIGGLCWYANNTIQSKLMIFVPRATALLTVILLYLALFIFFRRRDLSLLESTSQGTYEDEYGGSGERRGSMARVQHRLASWGRRASQITHTSTVRGQPDTHSAVHSPDPLRLSMGARQTPRASVVIHLPNENNSHADLHSHTDTAGSAASSNELPDIATFPGTRPVTMKRNSTAFEDQIVMATRDREAQQPRAPRRLSPRQINKRLSVLMMLYPLAYLIIFSVSAGRLIESIITHRPSNATLRTVARWLVFGQGFVDGILYFVIEYLFRRSTRGRT